MAPQGPVAVAPSVTSPGGESPIRSALAFEKMLLGGGFHRLLHPPVSDVNVLAPAAFSAIAATIRLQLGSFTATDAAPAAPVAVTGVPNEVTFDIAIEFAWW